MGVKRDRKEIFGRWLAKGVCGWCGCEVQGEFSECGVAAENFFGVIAHVIKFAVSNGVKGFCKWIQWGDWIFPPFLDVFWVILLQQISVRFLQ